MKSLIVFLCLFVFASFLPAEEPDYNNFFVQYLAIGVALSEDSLKDAQSHARKLHEMVPKRLQDDAVKTEEQTVNEQLETIQRLSDAIAKSTKLEQARKAYEEMSTLFMGLEARGNVPVAEYYCPMVKKSWLQKEGQITNPYAGKSMARCGEKKKSSKSD